MHGPNTWECLPPKQPVKWSMPTCTARRYSQGRWRELLRADKTRGLALFDGLKTLFDYLPITTTAMLRAADLWAVSRRTGLPTGDPKRLDIDTVLAAQALTLSVPSADLVVATSNVGHLSRFVAAEHWTNVGP